LGYVLHVVFNMTKIEDVVMIVVTDTLNRSIDPCCNLIAISECNSNGTHEFIL
jgi:hypothetical protein